MNHEQEIVAAVKAQTFGVFRNSSRVWIIEEHGGWYTVHRWYGPEWKYGPGVGPPSSYSALSNAAARLLQLMECGPITPQSGSEEEVSNTVFPLYDETTAYNQLNDLRTWVRVMVESRKQQAAEIKRLRTALNRLILDFESETGEKAVASRAALELKAD